MEAAKIKVHARLKPAKDIHVAFSNLLSCSDPNKFDELKQKLILSIETAEVEYKILQDEFNTIETLVDKWNNEIENCDKQQAVFEDENISLLHEKDEIEEEREKVNKLLDMKSTIKTEKIYAKMDSITKIQKENQSLLKEIKEVEKTNKRRKMGINEIEEGYQIFFLYKKPPLPEEEEDNHEEDEERINGENEERINEENEEIDDGDQN